MYECIKCKYKINKKSSMINHLNKLNKCNNIDSIKYNDIEIFNLSLIKIKDRIKTDIYCENCNKNYCNIYVLKKHKLYCIKNNVSNTEVLNNVSNTEVLNSVSNTEVLNNVSNTEVLNSVSNTEVLNNVSNTEVLNSVSTYSNTDNKIINNNNNNNIYIINLINSDLYKKKSIDNDLKIDHFHTSIKLGIITSPDGAKELLHKYNLEKSLF